MKPKDIKITRGMLRQGGIQPIPISTKGGPGKSSTIVTMIEVYRHLGLPINAASYEQPNSREHSRTKGIRK